MVLAFKVGVLDLNQLEDYITGSALHSLIPHVSIAKVRMALSSREYLKGELFHPWDDLLRTTEMAFPTNNLSLALASRTLLCVKVVVPPSDLYSSSHFAFALAFLALHNIIRVLSSSALAMRTSHLFLN